MCNLYITIEFKLPRPTSVNYLINQLPMLKTHDLSVFSGTYCSDLIPFSTRLHHRNRMCLMKHQWKKFLIRFQLVFLVLLPKIEVKSITVNHKKRKKAHENRVNTPKSIRRFLLFSSNCYTSVLKEKTKSVHFPPVLMWQSDLNKRKHLIDFLFFFVLLPLC